VSVGSVFMEIIPKIMGMSETLARDAVGPAGAAGDVAGKDFSTNFARTISAGAANTTAAMETQLRAATAAVESSSVAISAARDKEMAAADRVRIAEAKLDEARARGAADSSGVVAAEARLEAAKRGEATASERVVLAESNEGRAKEELVAKNDALAASQARVGKAAEESAAKSDASIAASGKSVMGMATQFGKLAGITELAIGVDAVHQAGNYQQSLTKLATTAGESTGNLKLVGDGMLSMAGQVGVSAQNLAKSMYVVESAGFHGADALMVMKSAAQGAKQENADLGHVTDAVTTALHDYNLPATDAAKVTSQLITAVSHGKTTFDELTGAMHSVTPVAAAAGISLAEASGALSAMTASGMSADQAAQNLGSTIKGLAAPTQPVIKEMAALGLSSVELSKNLGQKGVAGTLQEVSEAILKKMGPAGTTLLDTMNQSKLAGADAAKMFESLPEPAKKVAQAVMDGAMSFKEYRKTGGGLTVENKAMADSWLTQYKNASGFSQALKSGGNDTQTYMEALKRATGTTDGMAVALQVTGEHAGATNEAIKDIAAASAQADGNIKGWSEVQGNFNQQLSEVVNGLKSWVIELGQHLLPKATEFLGWLKDAAHWMGDHATLMKTIGEVILGAAAALVIYKTAMGAAEIATTAWKFALKAAAVAQGELDLAAIASPIGLVVVAIAALVAGFIYAYNHSETFREIVTVAFITVKAVVSEVVDWFKGPFVNFFKAAFDDVKNIATTFVNFYIGLPNLIVQRWDQLGGFFRDLWGKVTSAVSTGIDNTASFVETLPQRLAYGLGHLAGTMVRAAIDGWAGFTSGTIKAWNDTYAFVTGLPARLVIALVGLEFELRNTASTSWRGFTSGISTAWNDTYAFVTSLPSRIVIALVGLGVQLHDAAVSGWQGFTQGITEAWASTTIFFLTLPARIREYFATAATWLVDTGVAILRGLVYGLESGAVAVISWFTGLVSSFLGGFRDALGVQSPSTVFASIGRDILQGLINGLQALGEAVLTVVTNVGTSIIDGFRISITFLATMWLDLWTGIRDVATQIWTGIRDFLTAEMRGLANIVSTIWQGISAFFTFIWDVIKGVFRVASDLIIGILTVFLDIVTGNWSKAWTDIKDTVGRIWDDIKGTGLKLFGDFKDGLLAVFNDTKDGVVRIAGAIWDTVKNTFVGGINGVIDLVNGFLGAINTVAGAVGLTLNLHVPKLGEAGNPLPGRAAGGPIHGPGTGTSDSILGMDYFTGLPTAYVSAGEFVVNKKSYDDYAPLVEAINAGTLPRRADGGMIYKLPGLADGGVTWPAMLSVIQGQFPDALDNSDYRPGDYGYHGRGQALDVGFAGNDNSKLVAASQWIAEKYGAETRELIHQTGRNIKDGADVGDGYGLYGADTMAGHLDHTHWAMDHDPGGGGKGLLGTITGALGSAVSAIRHLAAGALDAAWPKMPVPQNMMGLPAATANKLRDGVFSFVNGKDQARGGAGGGAGGVIPTGEHLALIDAALAADGVPRGDWARWEAGMNTLIGRESGWNAGVFNTTDSNAVAGTPSGGLAQVIGPTFDAFHNPSLPNNLLDPVANIAASINYILSRYGDVSNVQQANPNLPPLGYDDGGWLNPGATGHNSAAKPEPVFSSSQWEVLRQNIRGADSNRGGATYVGTSVSGDLIVSDPAAYERSQRSNLLRASYQHGLPQS